MASTSKTTGETYGVVDAEGYHGDRVKVYRVFASLEQAQAYCRGRRAYRIIEGMHYSQGQTFFRSSLATLLGTGGWKEMPLR